MFTIFVRPVGLATRPISDGRSLRFRFQLLCSPNRTVDNRCRMMIGTDVWNNHALTELFEKKYKANVFLDTDTDTDTDTAAEYQLLIS